MAAIAADAMTTYVGRNRAIVACEVQYSTSGASLDHLIYGALTLPFGNTTRSR